MNCRKFCKILKGQFWLIRNMLSAPRKLDLRVTTPMGPNNQIIISDRKRSTDRVSSGRDMFAVEFAM